MNVLFIGNSYTFYNDMPTLFERLVNSNQKKADVRSVTQGGRRLISYADDNDPVTITLDTLLTEQKFDICFIQEQSLLPALDYNEFISGLDCVVSKLKDRVDRLILYATWGRNSGSAELKEHGWTTESMAHLLADAYQNAAKQYGADVSPVGNTFLYVTQNHPDINLYDEDHSHPSYPGSCLVALTHYSAVFGNFPDHTDALSLSDSEISAFRAAVCR